VDSRICQTSTASPAEPGELPVGLDKRASHLIHHYPRNSVYVTCSGEAQIFAVLIYGVATDSDVNVDIGNPAPFTIGSGGAILLHA